MMVRRLVVAIGQCSDRGRKPANQDFHGAIVPDGAALGLKGVAIGIADGISSSGVSHIASESAIKSFLTDYYCTSDAWSVKTSVYRVISATNSWLHAQTRRSDHAYDMDKGYVCTFSALVLKSATAHLFHVGDSRIYRLSGQSLEQLTEDHRVVVSAEQSYLGRALGMASQIEIDYRALALEPGAVFVLATDGVHEWVGAKSFAREIALHAADLDRAAGAIVAEALANGSPDNLTVQIVRIESVPAGDVIEAMEQASVLPPPPLLEARMVFDGYRIERSIHASSRSHIYLATDIETDGRVALKIPSLDLRHDVAYLKRMMMEEWIARRLDSAHVLKAIAPGRPRNFLYIVTEYVEGQTLSQWMIDNPRPDLETVRGLVDQIARGLRAFHRKEMVHQDLRPANIMIDRTGTVKIIDFGAISVAGVMEAAPGIDGAEMLGTAQYMAPEYFLGAGGSARSDVFSLGVIAYHMLTGRLPYGTGVAAARTRAQQSRLRYASALDDSRDIAQWVDHVLKKAVHPDPLRRYGSATEFAHDLRHPAERLPAMRGIPLLERNPAAFWKLLCLILVCVIVAQVAWQSLPHR